MTARGAAPIALAVCLLGACAAKKGTIGAVLGQSPDGHVYIREAPPDLAAAQAGLQPGDEVLLIDGKDVRQMSAQRIHEELSGEVDDPVKLTVLRGGEQVIRITLKRTPARRRRRPGEDAVE